MKDANGEKGGFYLMKVESLQDYLGKISEDNWIKLATNIFELTESICEDYPDYKEWYFHR